MDTWDAVAIGAAREELVHLDSDIETLIQRRDALRTQLQDACAHNSVGETPYRPDGVVTYARAPIRVCLVCGYAEEIWGVGPVALGPRTRLVITMSREDAYKHARGSRGQPAVRSNDDAVERARLLGKHGWQPRANHEGAHE